MKNKINTLIKSTSINIEKINFLYNIENLIKQNLIEKNPGIIILLPSKKFINVVLNHLNSLLEPDVLENLKRSLNSIKIKSSYSQWKNMYGVRIFFINPGNLENIKIDISCARLDYYVFENTNFPNEIRKTYKFFIYSDNSNKNEIRNIKNYFL